MAALIGVALLHIASTSAKSPDPSSFLRDTVPGEWYIQPFSDQTIPSSDIWWKSFGDPMFLQLLETAENNNFNVLAAARRIEAARQTLNIARSAFLPTVGLDASWQKGRSSGRQESVAVPASSYDYFSLGASMQWEIDVFGRVQANSKASKYAYEATRAEYVATMVSLATNLAKAYISLRMYQEQLAVAKAHIASQEKVTKLVEARFDAGIGNMLEVSQARMVLYSTQATIPGLQSLIDSSINAIAVLTGEYPKNLHPMMEVARPLPEKADPFEIGIPADVLRRRPDVVEAELQLAQCAAQVGVAKKDFLPTLSLTGSIGTVAHNAGDLFTSSSFTYSIAPQLSWTIFDGLARNYRVAEAKANMEEAIDNYNFTVLTALQEANNALSVLTTSQTTINEYKKVIEASQETLNLSVDLYKRGLASFTNVVDAQMDFLTYQNSLVEAKGKCLTALVTLYDALGGGWDGSLPDVK